jgi:DNA-binding transcriptional ArsR family regulator
MKRLSDEQTRLVVERARALGDPTRVRIIDVLALAEQPVGQIATALRSEPSLISKHLQVLFRAGLVVRRRVASAVIYTIASDELAQWCRYLASARLDREAAGNARMRGIREAEKF